ncbi:phospholipase D-like domain-containing protein [Prosthecomicrobium sp. N25]|uniref:phospholipase D-like domain-containing protein n=1 Tax=Prosthecomicrobium sp. N25 TaxID=3129254 RepID=UPI00307865E4
MAIHDAVVDVMSAYWPHITGAVALVLGAATSVHAIMTKQDVRAATAWTGVILLSPILGAVVYIVFGVNRVRRETRLKGREESLERIAAAGGRPSAAAGTVPEGLAPLRRLGDTVAAFPLRPGVAVEPLATGDDAYGAMLAAIDGASSWVLLETYIFDDDRIGALFAETLGAAVARGVSVRVLVDAIGSRYSRPPITRRLADLGIRHALFMDGMLGLRLAYANLRTHRKIMIVDGREAFMGGMNIRQSFSARIAGEGAGRDAHFRVAGPVVEDLGTVFAQDWLFSTGEELPLDAIFAGTAAHRPGSALARAVPSGPDQHLECTHRMILGALSVARERVLVASPYFLPDRRLVAAFAIAAGRGVRVDIVLPGENNLRLVDSAMQAQLDQILAGGCRVWRSTGRFDHAKLMAVDDAWAYVGSSNLDPRSLRLNFEIDLEVYDPALAAWIARHVLDRIATAEEMTREGLAARPFLLRLRDRTVWLASPYL